MIVEAGSSDLLRSLGRSSSLFNAKGGLYKRKDKVADKLNTLRISRGDHYEIVTYRLDMMRIEKNDLMDFLNQ